MTVRKNIPGLRFPEFEGEWRISKIGDIFKFKQGVQCAVDRQYLQGLEGRKRFIRIVDLTRHDEPFRFIDDPGCEHHVKEQDLFMVRYGTPGVVGFGFSGVIANNLFRIIPLKVSNYNPSYFYQVFINKKAEIESLAGSSTMPAINFGALESLNIIYPSLPEQQKIAAFLTAVDDKIHQLTRKKALLEQYKKGVMQQLFSQQLRFTDDAGNDFPNWEEKTLGEVFYAEKGKGISKSKIVEGGKYECVLYGELYTKYNEVIYQVVSKTNELDGLKSEIGDLLIPCSTTTTGIDLANVTALNKKDVLLGGDITVLRSHTKIDNVFYAYYLSNHKKEEIASYAQGITIVHLYYSHIKHMIIDLPSLDEQSKIASFLSAIDEKINHVTTQLQHTQQWKKGLLQQMFV